VLKKIRSMVVSIGAQPKLDSLILEAAGDRLNLKVAPGPRLVMFGGKDYQRKGNWLVHEGRLSNPFHIPWLITE
jgi:hypothetical protein